MTKLLLLTLFSSLLCVAQQSTVTVPFNTSLFEPTRKWSLQFFGTSGTPEAEIVWRQAEGDHSTVESESGGLLLRGGGKILSPAIGMRTKDGQGFHLAALPFGAAMSFYRRHPTGDMREWLRISYSGIQVADEHGTLKRAFTGTIRPGCAAVVTEGIVTGEDCGTAKNSNQLQKGNQ